MAYNYLTINQTGPWKVFNQLKINPSFFVTANFLHNSTMTCRPLPYLGDGDNLWLPMTSLTFHSRPI